MKRLYIVEFREIGKCAKVIKSNTITEGKEVIKKLEKTKNLTGYTTLRLETNLEMSIRSGDRFI